jgi:hypothetical protein
MFLREKNGQISIEFILLTGLILVLVILLTNILVEENELNLAMAAVRNGVTEGITANSVSIYSKTAFDDYNSGNPLLTYPQNLKIMKIERTMMGFDDKYNKKRIQLKIYVSSLYLKSTTDKNSMGDRINFNARKNIAITFHTTELSNTLFNPCFSDNYIFTTANVQWV